MTTPPDRVQRREAAYLGPRGLHARLRRSYETLEAVRLPNDLYLASPSADYSKVWIRDTFYEALPYVDKPTSHYERTYARLLDIVRKHEEKLDRAIERFPENRDDYLHPRYHAETLEEFAEPWGNKQHDAVGALLFGIAEGLEHGKAVLNDDKDRLLVQKVIDYLAAVRYWENPDNGSWEEYEELHASSIGACVAGLLALRNQGFDVPVWLTSKGMHALDELYPEESPSKDVDLALLGLAYPFRILSAERQRRIVRRVEDRLLRERGVIRYQGDSYYSTKEKKHGRGHPWKFYHGTEAEWTMGLPWLSIIHRDLGDDEKADYYLMKTRYAELEDGLLPELYFAGTTRPNPNTPLGWAVALHVIALERAGARLDTPLPEPASAP